MSIIDPPVNRREPRSCGTCSLCCNLLFVADLDKPENVWCQHATPRGCGCGIYATRPAGCAAFLCNWLTDPSLGDEWKPNRSNIIVSPSLGGRGLRISVDPDTPGVWRNEPFYARIKQWSQATPAGTGYVAVFAGAQCFVVFPEEDLEVSSIKPGSGVRAGYLAVTNGRQPIVQIRYADGVVKEFRGAIHSPR